MIIQTTYVRLSRCIPYNKPIYSNPFLSHCLCCVSRARIANISVIQSFCTMCCMILHPCSSRWHQYLLSYSFLTICEDTQLGNNHKFYQRIFANCVNFIRQNYLKTLSTFKRKLLSMFVHTESRK